MDLTPTETTDVGILEFSMLHVNMNIDVPVGYIQSCYVSISFINEQLSDMLVLEHQVHFNCVFVVTLRPRYGDAENTASLWAELFQR